MTARLPVRALLLVLLCGTPAGAQGPPADSGRTYVIVHGAWAGGWAFRPLDSLMTARGQTVHRPTLTGQGERVHLARPDMSLRTHINDVVNTILYEDLHDVVLVGHSYAGMVVAGVADSIPERIGRLVYLDAFLPEDGESVASMQGDPSGARMRGRAQQGYLLLGPDRHQRPPPREVPMAIQPFLDPISLRNPAASRIPSTYILTVDPGAERDAFSRYAERAEARGWPVLRMEADHNPMWTRPAELAEMLIAIP